ncbi:hypothetical protein [Pseudobdellovibrio exovorus]|uniref:Uncharacterized protein n=1 Tax=Pseudobdellovibrio exovorus JSS TaxID=1184267 RepID=M4VDI1_9BACT|nr:hypothetical protein [Pseudobdellovibrio exovorus]AGH96086.1 hypothetical protein A11Q_1870 [Pseudobdellovibrio exovorus JSS]
MQSHVYQKSNRVKGGLARRVKRLVGPRNKILRGYLSIKDRSTLLLTEARSAIELCQDDWDIDFTYTQKDI